MKLQSVALSTTVVLVAIWAAQACTLTSEPGAQGTSGSSNGASGAGVGGTPAAGGSPTSASGASASCDNVVACGGLANGNWTVSAACLKLSGGLDLAAAGLDPSSCTSATVTGTLNV